MKHDSIETLLDLYLRRKTSLEEDQRIEKWLEKNGVAEPAWPQLDRSSKDQWLSDVFTEIKTSITTNMPKKIPRQSQKHLWYRFASAAAVLFMILGVYLAWPSSEKHTLLQELTSTSTLSHQKKQITLADGTKVWLNAGSELKYPRLFNEKSRIVYLSGEAYFDVQHDDSKPFLIHTGKVLTTVLGTAFNIKEDQKRHTIEVTVTRGKVSVSNNGKQPTILTRNQQVSLDLLSGQPTEKTVNASTVTVWQNEEMLFDDITFADAAIQLQQHFQVKITFNNEKLKKCRFSGSTLKGDRLDKILDVISSFNNARWKMKSDGHIVIYGEGCN